jgi:hypothetical protein
MQIYLAARYSRHPEMQTIAHHLLARGHIITSRWIWGEHAAQDSRILDPDFRHQSALFAQDDLADLAAADWFISFSDTESGSRGGKHAEFGLALALKKRLVIIGGAEHVFHCLPEVEHYSALSAMPGY